MGFIVISSSRLAGIPLDHVVAEIAAFPFASIAALELCPVRLDPCLNNDDPTSSLWRRAEVALLGGFPAFSVDEIVALRDRLWFGNRFEGATALHHYLRHLAANFLSHHGPAAYPNLPSADRWDRADPNVQAPLARRAWRWLSLAMPADLLLGALGDPICGPTHVNTMTPAVETHLKDHGFAETHMHVGAALDFELYWSIAMRSIASSKTKHNAFRSPGAELNEGRDLAPWLIRTALTRFVLANFLRKERDSFLEYLHGLVRRSVTERAGSGGFALLLKALVDVERGRLSPDAEFAGLQGLYAELSRIQAEPPPHLPEPSAADPLAPILNCSAWSPRTPEVKLTALALGYFDRREEMGRPDNHFTALFWQTVRIRSLFYRHVVHRPLTPGLQWFIRFYDRGRAARQDFGTRVLLESARKICGGDHGLRSLEIRTAPADTRAEQQQYVETIAQAAAAWANRDRRSDDGHMSAVNDENRCTTSEQPRRCRSDDGCEVGLVLHFIKDRGGGISQGLPRAHWRDSNADPGKNPSGFRYAGFYLDRRRGAMVVEWLLRHRPLSLEILRGFDVCADEIGVPSWVLAPLLDRVRGAAEDGAQILNTCLGWSPPMIHTTAHAGEDFVHLLTGMRLLDEAIETFRLGSGDRIGHGLSLGVDPVDWARRAGMVPVAKEERLFDLVWEWRLYACYGGCPDPSRLSRLDREIPRLCDQIFGRGRGYQANDIENLWRDLRDPWMLYHVGFPDGRILPREDRDARTAVLCDYLSDSAVFRRGRELIWVEPGPEAEVLAGLQAQLRGKLGAYGITIEVNPTSNLLIGDLNDLTRHPLWRLRPVRDGEIDTPPVPICVGSDDPLVFNSNLRQEYQNLCDAMALAGYAEEEIRQWISRTRESGMESRFTISTRCDSILDWFAYSEVRPRLPI